MARKDDYSLVYDQASKEGFRWIAPTEAPAIDAKGDIMVGTGDDNMARLPVGPTGSVMVADPSHTTGIRWDQDINISAGTLDLGGKSLAGVAEPTSATDVATKNYVDLSAAALAIALG
jgi:hypothetical protein